MGRSLDEQVGTTDRGQVIPPLKGTGVDQWPSNQRVSRTQGGDETWLFGSKGTLDMAHVFDYKVCILLGEIQGAGWGHTLMTTLGRDVIQAGSRPNHNFHADHAARYRLSVAALAIPLILVLAPSSVQADPYGTGPDDEAGWLPDSATHTYCWGPNFTQDAFRSAANGRMANLASQTSMSRQFQASCSSGTDVRFELISGSNKPRGTYLCLSKAGQTCFAALVELNTTHLTNAMNRRKTACHEIGHSVGLQHGPSKTDCMVNGAVSEETSTYNGHHVNHINDYISCLSNPMCIASADPPEAEEA